jgi:hypothetical protein
VIVGGGLAVGLALALFSAQGLTSSESPYIPVIAFLFSAGIGGFVALLFSLYALYAGHRALYFIKRAGGAPSIRRTAQVGLIMGYCEVAIPIVCVIAFFALGAFVGPIH